MMVLRNATKSDCRLLWQWVNEPSVRASAFSSNIIPWETHVAWFNWKLSNSEDFVFIGLLEETIPIGQIRFEFDEHNEALVDISIDVEYQGKGLGTELIKAGVEEIVNEHLTKSIHAYIKNENFASRHAFEKAGFIMLEQTIINNCSCMHMRWQPNGS